MRTYSWIADAFRYPAPGRTKALWTGLSDIPNGTVKETCTDFLSEIEKLSLNQWEELYTRTLDLNPQTAPYIGFQTWGENYQRGKFMANLSQTFQSLSIDLDGELPDHIVPILRYLEISSQPMQELVDVLEPSITRMASVLRRADPKNPYLDLFEAILHAIGTLQVGGSLT